MLLDTTPLLDALALLSDALPLTLARLERGRHTYTGMHPIPVALGWCGSKAITHLEPFVDKYGNKKWTACCGEYGKYTDWLDTATTLALYHAILRGEFSLTPTQ